MAVVRSRDADVSGEVTKKRFDATPVLQLRLLHALVIAEQSEQRHTRPAANSISN